LDFLVLVIVIAIIVIHHPKCQKKLSNNKQQTTTNYSHRHCNSSQIRPILCKPAPAQWCLWWRDRREPKLDGLPQRTIYWFASDWDVHLL